MKFTSDILHEISDEALLVLSQQVAKEAEGSSLEQMLDEEIIWRMGRVSRLDMLLTELEDADKADLPTPGEIAGLQHKSMGKTTSLINEKGGVVRKKTAPKPRKKKKR